MGNNTVTRPLVVLDGHTLTLSQLESIVRGGAQVASNLRNASGPVVSSSGAWVPGIVCPAGDEYVDLARLHGDGHRL